jgi:hypothetical protein
MQKYAYAHGREIPYIGYILIHLPVKDESLRFGCIILCYLLSFLILFREYKYK